MARPRSPNREKAFKIYKRHQGKISNKEIADILSEDPKTISKWKKLDEWESKVEKENKKDKNSKNDSSKASYDYISWDEIKNDTTFEKEINDIRESDELNEKQMLFCIYFIQFFNATKAYKKAYNCSSNTARVNGSKLLAQTNIQVTISKLKQNRINRAMLSPDDIFQKYMDIAFSDITEFISFGKRDVPIGKDEQGRIVYQNVNYLDFNNSEEIDGSIIREFKEGKNGFSIKLEDRMKALQWLTDHLNMATEEQKAKIDSLRSKVKVEEEKLELRKKEFERNDF